MKKQAIIELIQENINGGSITPDIWKSAHPAVVEKYASMAFNTMFYNLFRKDLTNLELYCKWYYNIPITREDGVASSVLPIEPVQTPTKGDCIQDITGTDGQADYLFLPTTFAEWKRLTALGTTGRLGAVGYVLNSQIIKYYGLSNNVCEVDMYLLRSFESFSRNESVPIPMGKDAEFMQMMIAFLNTRPIDLNTDNNKT